LKIIITSDTTVTWYVAIYIFKKIIKKLKISQIDTQYVWVLISTQRINKIKPLEIIGRLN